MNSDEVKARVETIYWVTNVALLSYSRYKEILNNRDVFGIVFPDVNFDNPYITHAIDNNIIFKSTKKELIAIENSDLFTGWQIILGIVGMSSMFDLFLKSKVDEMTQRDNKILGIFNRFDDMTNIKLKQQSFYYDLRKYHKVRDISLHNRGWVNQEFKDKTNNHNIKIGPYVYYPYDLKSYKNLIEEAINYIETQPQEVKT